MPSGSRSWSGRTGTEACQRDSEGGLGFLRAGLVRHEAPSGSREGERPSPLGCRSSLVKPGGSSVRGTPVRVASGPDMSRSCRYCQTVRACAARSEGATGVNQWLTPRNSEAGSNLVEMVKGAISAIESW
jgi:hypothetical protein